MRPPRLLLVIFCLIFFPIFLTFFSALSSSHVATPKTLADDNSTFFLARPAAFGPLLPGKGLSGQLWVGSGFSEGGLAAGVEGELGCSDIPGWGEGAGHKPQDAASRGTEQKSGKSGSSTLNEGAVTQIHPRLPLQADAARQTDRSDGPMAPLSNDGTDDHLHHPLSESSAAENGMTQKYGDYVQVKHSTHADIQSLQETAEIQGKVVLLSRGGCGFLEKVKWAQRRGAMALIVGDDTRGGNLVTMYARGDTSNVTIPALFTSHTTAHLLSSLMPSHSGTRIGFGDALKSLQAKFAGQTDVDLPETTTTASATPAFTPTSTSSSVAKEQSPPALQPSGGFLRALGSFFGLCNRTRQARTASSRSSGDYDQRTRGKVDSGMGSNSGLPTDNTDGDGFVIGVQDWRDPDLMPARSSALPTPSTTATEKDSAKTAAIDLDAASTSNILRGGSITPSSGEYLSIDKFTGTVRDADVEKSEKIITTAHGTSEASGKGWFSSHFGWGDIAKQEAGSSSSSSPQKVSSQKSSSAHSSDSPPALLSEHEGLWVTMTPTSMSTSPFFDTLLVLVISPLLTLTVVYALLLLRSRIRRRRWRAPKSVIERLPVRTYHTISNTSSSSSTPRPSSPGAVSPTSPLLGESRSSTSRSNRSRSQTIAGVPLSSASREEKSTTMQSGSTLWRQKYTGRQVECVVCLEEYVDGQSRVMSLPCGHEFHAECITPWLTTRRRTCPICKGDVVRSMAHSQAADITNRDEHSRDSGYAQELEAQSEASSSPVLIPVHDGDASDTEQTVGLLDGHPSSAPHSSWRNLASLSFSALSGDTIWHQAHADRNR
ncbi:uncharacterized protein N7477_000623 [Penicillium maclennaniae]|uniref:uncharacterized protein n=1 Tax=Penicillium maclennaniae TaxID=1343394 RepID=UPI0025405C50|nr:uncharacterized protein N7477_000623 [Penicillium maclennaniae]KAJ5684278.1 hypothetical protein N7477_000623 [Penicillium maclennaniae]